MRCRWLCAGVALALLAGCAGGGGSKPDTASQKAAAKSSSGRYALESDAYPDQPPDVSNVPDAVPRVEPLARSGNRPTYEVWGESYQVLPDAKGYSDQGRASWYGEKFQGYATASGEIYDMYKMTAAHRSLPLPTYARVTNIDNDRSVIVKVNDRGPFHGDRLIDLSYAAAARLDILRGGTGRVRVEAIDPVAWQARQQDQQDQQDTRQAEAEPADMSASTERVAATSASRSSTPQASAPEPASSASAGNAASMASVPAVDTGGERLYLQVAALGSATSARELQARLQREIDNPVRIASDDSLHRVQVGPVDDRLALETLRRELQRVGYAQSFAVTASE